jgi:putative hemolysin
MEEVKFIDIRNLVSSKNPRLAKWLPEFVFKYLEKVLHQNEINDFISKHKHLRNQDFCDALVHYLNLNIRLIGEDNLPSEGPVIIAMNHPLGGMDAMALVSGVKGIRKDMKFIVNDILMNLDNLKDLFVGVNKHGANEKTTRQRVIDLFKSSQVICIFPAGLVSRKVKGQITDLEWKKTFVTYARKYKIPVLPVHIDGELSSFFYRLANFRKLIGTKANIEMLYLADELFKQRNKTITFTFGEPLNIDSFSSKDDLVVTNEIKNLVYQLSVK